MSARRAFLSVVVLVWSAAFSSANDELSCIWSDPSIPVRQRAAAVGRAFTHGTPVSVIVAALGTNYTRCFNSARLWVGPGPEPRNTGWLEYQFGEESVTIDTSADISEDPVSGLFTGAGYSIPAGHSTSTTNKIWIGKADGSQPEWAKESGGTTNRIWIGQQNTTAASVVANLVEQLVSPIGPPPEEVKEYNGSKSDTNKLKAHLKALTQGWMAPQVAEAREKLISMGTPIFPELVKHLDDERYSYSFCYAGWVDHPVGYAVQQIMGEVVAGRFRPYGYKWRDNSNGSNGQPSFGQMMREIDAEKYAEHAKEITTKQAEKEYVQWYMEKEKGHGFKSKQQEQDILGPCVRRLSEL